MTITAKKGHPCACDFRKSPDGWWACDHIDSPCPRNATGFAKWALGFDLCDECSGLKVNRDNSNRRIAYCNEQQRCDDLARAVSTWLR